MQSLGRLVSKICVSLAHQHFSMSMDQWTHSRTKEHLSVELYGFLFHMCKIS